MVCVCINVAYKRKYKKKTISQSTHENKIQTTKHLGTIGTAWRYIFWVLRHRHTFFRKKVWNEANNLLSSVEVIFGRKVALTLYYI